MKKKILILLIIAIIAVAPGVSVMYGASSQENVTIKVATLAPVTGDWMNNFRSAMREIKQKTNNRVSVSIYPGGVMGNDAAVLRKMRIGQIDGASFTAGGISAVYPDFQILSMPLLFRNYEEVDYVRSRIDPIIMNNLEKRGYIPLLIADTGFVYMMSNKPISNISSLKGLKIWIPEGDPIGRIVFELAGVPPIPLPIADVLTGLRTGLINTFSNTPSGTLLLQWHSMVKYLTDMPILYAYGTLILSKRGYLKIPEQDRQIVRNVIKEKMVKVSGLIRDFNNKSLDALKKFGIKFITLSGRDRAENEEFGVKVRNSLIEEKLFSTEIVSKIEKALSEYREKTKK